MGLPIRKIGAIAYSNSGIPGEKRYDITVGDGIALSKGSKRAHAVCVRPYAAPCDESLTNRCVVALGQTTSDRTLGLRQSIVNYRLL